jgi:MtN3 and saliva related transmembrane protein
MEEHVQGLWIGILGITATTLSVLSLTPQVVRTWRTRSATDISAVWLTVALVAATTWGVYGILIDSQAVIWANVAAFLQCGSILFVKLRTERPRAAQRA